MRVPARQKYRLPRRVRHPVSHAAKQQAAYTAAAVGVHDDQIAAKAIGGGADAFGGMAEVDDRIDLRDALRAKATRDLVEIQLAGLDVARAQFVEHGRIFDRVKRGGVRRNEQQRHLCPLSRSKRGHIRERTLGERRAIQRGQ
jgi:hypothetical protein